MARKIHVEEPADEFIAEHISYLSVCHHYLLIHFICLHRIIAHQQYLHDGDFISSARRYAHGASIKKECSDWTIFAHDSISSPVVYLFACSVLFVDKISAVQGFTLVSCPINSFTFRVFCARFSKTV